MPSGYFLTDVMMMLDQEFFAEKLLVGHERKLHLAAHEGVKLKKLVGAVRALWRSSPSANHPKVNQLKSLLRKSPPVVKKVSWICIIGHVTLSIGFCFEPCAKPCYQKYTFDGVMGPSHLSRPRPLTILGMKPRAIQKSSQLMTHLELIYSQQTRRMLRSLRL